MDFPLARKMNRIASFGTRLPDLISRTLRSRNSDVDSGEGETLGDRAVRLGLATQEQVRTALMYQTADATENSTRPPLGAVMVRLGVLSPAELAHLLSKVANAFQPSPDAVRLAVTLQSAIANGAQSIVFTSFRREDGAALLTAQVGLALALMEQRPLTIIDCDREEPSIERHFGLPPLAAPDCVPHRLSKLYAERPTGITGLTIAAVRQPRGERIPDLVSDASFTLLAGLRRARELAFLSAPPVIQFPEAAVLAARADATILVAGAGVTSAKEIATAERLLSGVNAKVLGIVLSDGFTSK